MCELGVEYAHSASRIQPLAIGCSQICEAIFPITLSTTVSVLLNCKLLEHQSNEDRKYLSFTMQIPSQHKAKSQTGLTGNLKPGYVLRSYTHLSVPSPRFPSTASSELFEIDAS